MIGRVPNWEIGWMWCCCPQQGMPEKKALWGEHSEFSIGHFKHFFTTECKRTPCLFWIPCLKTKEKEAMKDNLCQAFQGPNHRTWNFIHRTDLKIH